MKEIISKFLREPIPGLVLTDTCWKYVDLNEVLKLIKAYK